LGAAYLAGLATNYWKNAAEIQKCWKQDRIFSPKMSRKDAAALYKNWLGAVRRTLSRH
jgi:glycerol kinase